MKLQPARYVAFGQTILGAAILICLVLVPHYFFSLDQGGISNYGTEKQTIWIFVVGFGAATLGSTAAALALPAHTSRRTTLRLGLLLLSVLYAFVALSTFGYKLSEAARHLHEQSAILLFIAMLAGTLWLRFVAAKDSATKRAFTLFCFGFVAATLTLFGVLHVLFTAQLVCGIAFAYMLVHGINILTHGK